jgi:8-oxo-dGTP pyrophosphatase MutT (NUDIX family)
MKPLGPTLEVDWQRRLKASLDMAPARPRSVLELVGKGQPVAVIGSIEPALAARLAAGALPLREAGFAWRIESSPEVEAASTLAAIARWLHVNHVVAGWRDELLAIADTSGVAVGEIERAAVRPLGIATHAVHLVACDARGHVWVQQRALDKATDPGLWDTTMGGLVSAGESTQQTLARETWEEAGLRMTDLRDIAVFGQTTVRRPVAEGYMVEHIDMFEATVRNGRVPVNQDGEVVRFECLDRVVLVERMHADAFTLEAALILATWLGRPAATGR